jgi:electron transfer flavoprotein alpha subunit
VSSTVLVVGELLEGRVVPVTLEALGVARTLAGPSGETVVLLVGARARAAAAGASGGERVMVAEDPQLDFSPIAAVAIVATAAARALQATFVVLGGTTFGRDLAGRMSARWDASAATGVIDVAVDGPSLRVRRPVFGGRATETLRLEGPRTIVAIRPHAFPAVSAGGGAPPVESAPPVELPANLLAPKRLGLEPVTSGGGPALADAAIVVSGGRGLRTPEEFRLVEDLAKSLGAAVGASRAVTDAGWRPASFQVGQTGKAVSPQLYIAVGISGAIQHLVGMVSSRVIVAINSDASAPIFKVADYGIVGDLFQIVPALTAEVRRARGG